MGEGGGVLVVSLAACPTDPRVSAHVDSHSSPVNTGGPSSQLHPILLPIHLHPLPSTPIYSHPAAGLLAAWNFLRRFQAP